MPGVLLGILLVIVVSTSTYLAAQILSGLHPERTAVWLDALRRWIETHRDRVIDVVLLGVGALAGHPRRGGPAREVRRPSTCRKTLGPPDARRLA